MHKFAVSVITPEAVGEAPLALFEGDFSERLAKAESCGFTGIELVTCDPAALDSSSILSTLQEHSLQAAAVATGYIAASRGLTLISPNPEVRAQAAGLLKDLILFAADVKAPVVTIGSFRGKPSGQITLEEASDQLAQVLSGVDDLASSLGIRLALESIRPQDTDLLTNAEETCAFVKAAGLRSAGLLLDSYHVFGNEPDPLGAFALWQKELVHVHLADSERRAVGEGDFDFAGMEAALGKIGYSGWQSLELARAEDPDGNAARSIQFLRSL